MSDLLPLESPFQYEMFKGRFNKWKGGRVVNVARQQVNTVTATHVTVSIQKLWKKKTGWKKKMFFCSDTDLPIPAKMQNDLKAGKI